MEPEDEGIHLRRAERHLHHRPEQDGEEVPRRRRVRHQPGGRRQDDPLRRHQAAGAGRHLRGSAALRDVLHQPALAGRPAHQLHDHSAQPRPAPRPRGDGHRRPLRHALEEGNRPQRKGEAEAPEEPRGHPADVAAARRDLRRRHAQGKDRRRRGAQAQDSGDRHRRHQLRPGRSRFRDPGQRRRAARDPAVCVEDRRGGDRPAAGCASRGSRKKPARRPRKRPRPTPPPGSRAPRGRSAAPNPRPPAPSRPGHDVTRRPAAGALFVRPWRVHFGAGLTSPASVYDARDERFQHGNSNDYGRSGQAASRQDRRGHDGVQGRADRSERQHGGGDHAAPQARARAGGQARRPHHGAGH